MLVDKWFFGCKSSEIVFLFFKIDFDKEIEIFIDFWYGKYFRWFGLIVKIKTNKDWFGSLEKDYFGMSGLRVLIRR